VFLPGHRKFTTLEIITMYVKFYIKPENTTVDKEHAINTCQIEAGYQLGFRLSRM